MLLRIKGYVDEEDKLNFEHPTPLAPGEVTITIEGENEEDELAPLKFEGLTNAEIMASGAVGSWADKDIADSQAFVEEIRRKQRESRGL
jgi:hypothetical protein